MICCPSRMAMLILILVLLSFVTLSTAGTGEIVCRGWGSWGAWGACDVTCGEGTMKRGRIPLGEGRCEGSGEGTMACVLAACPTGCDPKTIDFNKAALLVKPQEHIKEEWLLGGWYAARWYLNQNATVNDTAFDPYMYGYQKEGQPDKIFMTLYLREKTKECCAVPMESIQTRKSHGIYEWSPPPFGASIYRVTKLYVTEVFLMELFCVNPNEEVCMDYSVQFWSRCRVARPQDIAKAESILKKMCFPHMKRFVDGDHKTKCWKMENRCSERNGDYKEGMRRSHWRRWDDDDDYHGVKCGARGRCYDDNDDDMRPHRRGRWDGDNDDDMRPHRRGRWDDDDDDDGDDHVRGRGSYNRAGRERNMRPRRYY